MKSHSKNSYALVLSGGGARGAYEAGVIHYVRSVITPNHNILKNFDIYCGSSVGSINTCYCASRAHGDAVEKGNGIYQAWKNLKQDQIYKRNFSALTQFLFQSTAGVTLNFFRKTDRASRKSQELYFKGLFDTTPLQKFLTDNINFKQLNHNVQKGPVSAVSITATNLHTGYLELFVKKKPQLQYSGGYVFRPTEINHHHAMASSAIPIAFPSHQIDKYYYCDGGLRLNTPMSPAIQLGANKIFIIGLHNKEERQALKGSEANDVLPPTLGEIIGKIFHTIFLDRIEYDLEQLTRINRIIEWGEMTFGEDFLDQINQTVSRKNFTGDIASRGLKNIEVFSIFPSRDVRDLFSESLEDKKWNNYLGPFEKMLLKMLDVDLIQGKDFLSYLFFMPSYLEKLIQLGYEDAQAKHNEIVNFLSNKPS